MNLGNLRSAFHGFVVTMEERPWGPVHVFGILAAVIVTRNILEIGVAQNPVFSGLAAFVHYPLAYLGPFLSLTLVLAFWGRVAPARVARLMALAWLLTLTPPLTDLLLDRHSETPTIGYLEIDPTLIPWVFARFFDPGTTLEGTTAGIRVEAFAAVVLGALYAGMRSGSWLRAIACSLSVYVVSLFWFLLPNLAWLVLRLFVPGASRGDFYEGESLLPRLVREDAFDATGVLWLTPIVLGLFLAWRALERSTDGTTSWCDPPAHRPDADSLAGIELFLAVVLFSGFAAALSLRYHAALSIVVAPFDLMAPLGALLALFAFCASARAIGRGGPVFLSLGYALAGTAIVFALGTPAALGIVGAALPLLAPAPKRPSGLFATLRSLGVVSAGTLSAFSAGTALVYGREVLARVPPQFYVGWLAAALALGVAVALRGRLSASLALALAPLVMPFALGATALYAVALPFALLIGLAAYFVDARQREQKGGGSGLRVSGGLAAIAVALVLHAVLLNEETRAPLDQRAHCVARLERLRGEKAQREGALDLARSAYKSALRCDERDLGSLRGLGQVALANERWSVAERRFTSALEVAQTPDLYSERALARFSQGRHEEAFEDLERGLALEPKNPTLLFNRASLLAEAGRKDEAIAAWETYLDKVGSLLENPDAAEARRRLRRLKRGLPQT